MERKRMDYTKDYENLKKALLEDKKWPRLYMFKFIVPNRDGKVEEVKLKLPDYGKMSFKHTENLKFVSITCVAMMESADQIIEITDRIACMDGVMAL